MKLGLVFSGGGGKGAYEIGVWKYLHEIGLDDKVEVVSGTSVGGLNAALFGSCDYETAEKIWTEEISVILSAFHPFEHNAISGNSGLAGIIDRFLDCKKIRASKKRIYVTCCTSANHEPHEFLLNKLSDKEIKDCLLSTSAMYPVFPRHRIIGNLYVDGGWKRNLPVNPIYSECCTHAIVVNLNHRKMHLDQRHGIDFIEFFPSQNLGGLQTGTLDFELENALSRIKLGYGDVKHSSFSGKLKKLSEKTKEQNMTEEQLRKKVKEMSVEDVLEETLRYVVKDNSLLSQIQDKYNVPGKTLGGKVYYTNMAEYKGWKFQVHFKDHLRLLDSENVRRAWTMDKEKYFSICRKFLLNQWLEEENEDDYLCDRNSGGNLENNSVEGRLNKLKKLFDSKLIDEADYSEQKKRILQDL